MGKGVTPQQLKRWSGIVLEKLILLSEGWKVLLLVAVPVSAGCMWFLWSLPVWGEREGLRFLLLLAYLWLVVNLIIHLALTWIDRWELETRRRIAGVCMVGTFICVCVIAMAVGFRLMKND